MHIRIQLKIVVLLLLKVAVAGLLENSSAFPTIDQRNVNHQNSSTATVHKLGASEYNVTTVMHSSDREDDEQNRIEENLAFISNCSILEDCAISFLDYVNYNDYIMIFTNAIKFNHENEWDCNETMQEFRGNLSKTFFPYDVTLRNRLSELQTTEFLSPLFNVMCHWRTSQNLLHYLETEVSSDPPRSCGFDFIKRVSEIKKVFFIGYETYFLNAQNSMNILESFYNNNKIKYDTDLLLNKDCFNEKIITEYLQNAKEVIKILSNTIPYCHTIGIFHNIIDPILSFVVVIIDIAGNGTIILIFVRHREMRTSHNVLILNLAINDILSVSIGIPIFCTFPYYNRYVAEEDKEIVFLATLILSSFQYLSFIVSAFSVLGLSVQRYLATSSFFHNTERCISNRTIAVLYIMAVWGLALVAYGPGLYFILFVIWSGTSESIGDLYLLFLSVAVYVLIPVTVLVLNILISRRLKQSLRDLPGQGNYRTLYKLRNKGSKVAISLGIAFVVSYLLPFLIIVLNFIFYDLNEDLANIFVIFRVCNYLFYTNVLAYPLALYISCSTYRKFFNKYLFRCCNASDKRQTVTQIESFTHNNETQV